MEKWEINTIDTILPEAFHQLIENNKAHIEKTFPVTLASCIDLEHTIDFINKSKRNQKKKEGYYFYIKNVETQNLMGYLCIKNINHTILKCELAYFIDKEFQNKGIISKAIVEIIHFCFTDLAMNKIFICTSKTNISSQRIALKQGFKQEGILREEFKNGNQVLEDIVYFGLLKSDYHER